MDPQVYAKRRIAQTTPAHSWRSGSPEEIHSWQDALHTRLRELVGWRGYPAPPESALITETRDFPEYRRETVQFESRPGMTVVGYFLTPREASEPRPGILCLPGHGRGVESIIGIDESGGQRAWGDWGEYQADFALQCVANGYPTFAIEQVSFGHRRDAQAMALGGGASSCVRDSMAALMLGETITGWRAWDASCALGYLANRPEVEGERLATMGISGGGLTSLFTACLDARVKVAVVSGYLNTFRDSILAMDHCVDNYVPGLLEVAEMPDLIGLVAPRYLFAESGTQDPIFPLGAFREAEAQGREIYAAFGVPARFETEVFEGEHRFHGVGAFAFLAQHL